MSSVDQFTSARKSDICMTEKHQLRRGHMTSSSNSRFCFAVLSILAMTPSMFGQAGPPSKPNADPDQAQGISVGVDEVSLDLAVKDKHHKPVLDLKAEDIEVTDNGVPVTLKDFR